MSEANAVQSRARARKTEPEPQLTFRRQLAKLMLTNKIGSDGTCPQSPIRLRKRGRDSDINQHAHLTKPKFTGKWISDTGGWSTVTTEYLKSKCRGCIKEVRTYCACDKSVPLCKDCYGKHCGAVGHT